MRNNFETITTADKQKRDEMYADLKAAGNALERQVVKFSDSEPTGETELVWYERGHEPQRRLVYRSTWSLAYPKSDL